MTTISQRHRIIKVELVEESDVALTLDNLDLELDRERKRQEEKLKTAERMYSIAGDSVTGKDAMLKILLAYPPPEARYVGFPDGSTNRLVVSMDEYRALGRPQVGDVLLVATVMETEIELERVRPK